MELTTVKITIPKDKLYPLSDMQALYKNPDNIDFGDVTNLAELWLTTNNLISVLIDAKLKMGAKFIEFVNK